MELQLRVTSQKWIKKLKRDNSLRQLSFHFSFSQRLDSANFIPSQENMQAFNLIKNLALSSNISDIINIFGPKSCGKTHLVNIACNESQAILINNDQVQTVDIFKQIQNNKTYIFDDIELIKNETFLLYLVNSIKEKSAKLIITSKNKIVSNGFKIKDLASRMNNIVNIEISPPSDEFARMLLYKSFSEKQLDVDEKVIEYILKNISKQYAKIFEISAKIENLSFDQKRKINLALVRSVIYGDIE